MDTTLHPFPPKADRSWSRFLGCCFAAIVGLRLFLIERYAASVPFVDDWDATGRKVLEAWRDGTFTLRALFAAHLGDHRIVATRLWEILWYEANGAWDPKLVMLTKSFVFAAAAVAIVHLLAGRLERSRYLIGGGLAFLFAMPFGYQNLVWAFQSQFDFFLLAAATGLLALTSGRLVAAVVIAALAPFTLAAGPILAASYIACAGVWALQGTWPLRRALWISGASVAILVGGVALRVAEGAPPHTLGEKGFTFLNLLGWPYSNLALQGYRLPETASMFPGPVLRFPSANHSLLAGAADLVHAHLGILVAISALLSLLMLWPLLLLALESARRGSVPRSAWGAVGLAAFAVLLQAATALVRAGEMTVQTRYLDVVALTGFAAMAAAGVLAFELRCHRRLLASWAVVLGPAYLITIAASFVQLSHGKQAKQELWLANVRAYYQTHDRSVLPENTNWQLPINGDDRAWLADLLDDPKMATILPRAITAPDAAPRPVAAFASRVARLGLLISGLGALGAAAIAFTRRRWTQVAATTELAGDTGDLEPGATTATKA